jgi:hypothetical protein
MHLFLSAAVGLLCLWPGTVGCGSNLPRTATTSAIFGLVRDQATGTHLPSARLVLRADGQLAGQSTVSGSAGAYAFSPLQPGTYELTAHYAGEVVQIRSIAVTAARTTAVDVWFVLGRKQPLVTTFGDTTVGQIAGYTSVGAAGIEGTVTDAASRERVEGAVVTLLAPGETRQYVSDAHGRFHFTGLSPGVYSVTAFYSIADRGHIEVQRNQIEVTPDRTVIVPLWIELEGQ